MSPEEQAADVIRNAEASKARMFPPTGESFDSIIQADYDYLVVRNHVDQNTQAKCSRVIKLL